jgi:protocatechuate 3,4-dioxygenase beta subunit
VLTACASGAARLPAIPAPSCQLTPGDRQQGVDRVPVADVSWRARLGPGKELSATPANIAAGARGQRLVLEGMVLDAQCRPLAGAVVDAWQVTADGVYGPAGSDGGIVCCYLTATVRTNDEGRFELQTVMPGRYSGAPAHIHVGIAGPRGGQLLTEIEFRSGGTNVVEAVTNLDGSLRASFDFVIATSA